PDPEPWRAIGDPADRLRQGLAAIYDWYARNAKMLSSVMRDAEHHALTRETAALRFAPLIAAYNEVLGEGLGERQRALLALALSFHTWRTLAGDGGLPPGGAGGALGPAVGGPPPRR